MIAIRYTGTNIDDIKKFIPGLVITYKRFQSQAPFIISIGLKEDYSDSIVLKEGFYYGESDGCIYESDGED